MKTILIIMLSLFLGSTLYSTELAWVDEQVNAIKPPRKGANISSIKSPFVFFQKNTTKSTGSKKSSLASTKKTSSTGVSLSSVKKSAFILSAVINSSAMINDSWYKKNDNIKGYTVVEIDKTSVTLKKGDKKLILSTNSKNQNLKFKNK